MECARYETFQIAYDNVHHRQTLVGQFGRSNTHLLLKMVDESVERRRRIDSNGGFSNQTMAEVAPWAKSKRSTDCTVR